VSRRYGGMGSGRSLWMSGLTFDHILSRLQGELQKRPKTGAESHNLHQGNERPT
jgi:hypothetical protein